MLRGMPSCFVWSRLEAAAEAARPPTPCTKVGLNSAAAQQANEADRPTTAQPRTTPQLHNVCATLVVPVGAAAYWQPLGCATEPSESTMSGALQPSNLSCTS
jgi:hypothetical protein